MDYYIYNIFTSHTHYFNNSSSAIMDSHVTLTSAMMRDDWWREELVKMDLPQLEDIISKLECEVVSVQSFIDSSKFTLEQGGMLSTFVARELEREHWAIEVDETK